MKAPEAKEPARSRVSVLRSKNAGPYYLTLDVVFREQRDFDKTVRTLRPEDIAREYGVEAGSVTPISDLPALRAIKVSLLRRFPAGHPGCSDCYGMNQEEPLARLLFQLLEAKE